MFLQFKIQLFPVMELFGLIYLTLMSLDGLDILVSGKHLNKNVAEIVDSLHSLRSAD